MEATMQYMLLIYNAEGQKLNPEDPRQELWDKV